MALLKYCRCGQIIAQTQRRCIGCENKYADDRKGRHRRYDHYKRDKDSAAFYNSPRWKQKRSSVKRRDNGLCLLCLSKRTITHMDMVHHIEPLKENEDKALDSGNLISLCDRCHGQVEAKYEKSKKDKDNMQKRLTALVAQGVGGTKNF